MVRRQRAVPVDDPGGKRYSSSEVVLSPSVVSITTWTVGDEGNRPIALVVPGASHYDRQQVLKPYIEGEWRRFHSGIVIDAEPPASTSWLSIGLVANFLERVRTLRMPEVPKVMMSKDYPFEQGPWELLWNLVSVDEFVVDEPLRQLVDKPFYLVHDVHRVLWEARFLARENASLQAVDAFMTHFARWIMGEALGDEGQRALSSIGIHRLIASDAERMDVLCFLLSIACQNGLLERSVFFFDDLERALQPSGRSSLRQLRDLLECARRWAKLGGSPLGFLIGFSGSKEDTKLLEKYNAALASDVALGLQWSRRALSS